MSYMKRYAICQLQPRSGRYGNMIIQNNNNKNDVLMDVDNG